MNTYVLLWRDEASPRLRTWVDEASFRPLALPLADITPHPVTVIDSPDDFASYLTRDKAEPAAVLSSLVQQELGWEVTERESPPEP